MASPSNALVEFAIVTDLADAPKLEPLADGTGFRVRVRFGTKQQRRFRIPTTDQDAAAARALELTALGTTIGRAKIDPDLGASLLAMAGAGDVSRARKIVAKLAAGMRVGKETAAAPGPIQTFRDLGQAPVFRHVGAARIPRPPVFAGFLPYFSEPN